MKSPVEFNLMYNGLQQFKDKSFPMFTHKEYGTFVVGAGETFEAALNRKKHQFETSKKEDKNEIQR